MNLHSCKFTLNNGDNCMMTVELKQLFQTYWKNLKFRVRLLKDIPLISEQGDKISSLAKNSETSMEFWKVKTYLENDQIELVQPKLMEISDLDRIFMREKNNSELQQLDDSFYLLTNYLIERQLKEENKPSLDTFEKGQKIKNLVENIIERRIYKILKILNLREADRITKNLTFEEITLFKNLFQFFDDWKRNICSFSSK